jgi:hypothetical protein
MRVAEKSDWKGLKIKKGVGNRKIIMSDEVRHWIGKLRLDIHACSYFKISYGIRNSLYLSNTCT